tara:strand:- start:2570 stop:2884 length:315 start_codon:yes stop_codon:yes gene_type:complete
MSVKLALLKSGETLIADIKELVLDKEENSYGYLFKNPKRVNISSPMLLTEESDQNEEASKVQVSLTSWFLITKDTEFALPRDWIVTIMEPVDRLVGMYEESLNG